MTGLDEFDQQQAQTAALTHQALVAFRSTGQFVSSREADAVIFGVEFALDMMRDSAK